MSASLAAVLLGSYLIKEPLFVTMATKYKDFLPEEIRERIARPEMIQQYTTLTLYVAIALFGHAAVTAFAAQKMSNWWWLAIRGFGFYFFLAAATIALRFTAS